MMLEQFCYLVSFLAEALITCLYCDYLFRRKRAGWKLAASFALGYLALYAVSTLGSTTLNALAFFFLNFLLLRWNYPCGGKTALLHTAFLCFVMIGAELLVMLLLGLFGYAFSSFTQELSILILLTALSKTLYLVLSTLAARLFSPHGRQQDEPRLMALFCSLPLLSAACAIAIVYYGTTVGISGAVGVLTAAIVLILLGVNFLVLALYNALQQANEEYLNLQLSIQKEQADAAYYQALQKQYETQLILIHDIRNHLGAISTLAQQADVGKITDYISEMDSTLLSVSQAKLCSDSALNSLLLHWMEVCKQANLAFHCDVRDLDLSFLDAPSVTTLFGNLLSNAVEAAARSAEKELELSVSCNEQRSVMMISVINSCDAAPVSDGHGGFLTRKKDAALHGVGLRSIGRVVRRYHGVSTMYYDAEKKQFHHILQFPLPES